MSGQREAVIVGGVGTVDPYDQTVQSDINWLDELADEFAQLEDADYGDELDLIEAA